MCRQAGETMVSYVDRRKKWWKMILNLDSSISLPNSLLGAYLLDHSGLSRDQKLMIMTSVKNVTTFNDVAEALIKQRGTLRLTDDKGKGSPKGKGKGKYPFRPFSSKGKQG